MNKQIDNEIKARFLQDNYISNSTKNKINEVLEQNRNVNMAFENKGIKMRKWISALATVMVVFLGANVYAYSTGNANIFSMIANILNINSEEYEKEKIEVGTGSTITKDKILTLEDYAYNDEVLIVNYSYQSSNNSYNDIVLMEDLDKLCLVEDSPTEYPVYEIVERTIKQEDNKYYICKVYDMNNIKKENGKVNLVIKEILCENNQEMDLIESCNAEFSIALSENKKDYREYEATPNILNLDLDKLKQKKEIETFGLEQIKISKILDMNFSGLIYLNSDVELNIFEGMEDESKIYTSARYSFEITDEKGNVINTRENQELILSMDASQQILIVNSLGKSEGLNIKVYEDTTNTLISDSYVQLNIEK